MDIFELCFCIQMASLLDFVALFLVEKVEKRRKCSAEI